MLFRFAAALGLAVTPVLAAAPAAAADTRTVVVLGDSLTLAAADEHGTIATSRGYRTADLAFRGASMIHWQPAAADVARVESAAVVLALGTNDAAYARWVDPLPYWQAALDALRGRCVVVVAWQRHTAADRALWARLAPLVGSYANVRVFDWHGPAARARGVVGPDGVHHTPTGELAYAWSLHAAQEMCR